MCELSVERRLGSQIHQEKEMEKKQHVPRRCINKEQDVFGGTTTILVELGYHVWLEKWQKMTEANAPASENGGPICHNRILHSVLRATQNHQ